MRMGFTEVSALRYVMKRRRGIVGALVGDDVRELVAPTENRTLAALRLIVEHGFKPSEVAGWLNLDSRNVRRLVPDARRRAEEEKARQAEFAKRTTVS